MGNRAGRSAPCKAGDPLPPLGSSGSFSQSLKGVRTWCSASTLPVISLATSASLTFHRCSDAVSYSLTAGDFDPLRVNPAVVLGEQGGDHRPDVVRYAGASKRGRTLTEMSVISPT